MEKTNQTQKKITSYFSNSNLNKEKKINSKIIISKKGTSIINNENISENLTKCKYEYIYDKISKSTILKNKESKISY
jgi:hypothetical protein